MRARRLSVDDELTASGHNVRLVRPPVSEWVSAHDVCVCVGVCVHCCANNDALSEHVCASIWVLQQQG